MIGKASRRVKSFFRVADAVIKASGLFPKRGGEHAMSLDKDSAGVPPCPHPDCVPKVSHEIECRCDIA